MDPYLETHWLDVHARLVTYSADELNALLPDSLVARIEERAAVESEEGISRGMGRLIESDPITERFVRIMNEAGRLVTVIEFISPMNKRQPGLDAYRLKRSELLSANVSVVEVDLIRTGDWRALMRPLQCPSTCVSPYRVTICLASQQKIELYLITLRGPLPVVSIPLSPSEARVGLNLQPLLDRAYEKGRYGVTLDYRQPLDPPLSQEDAEWADALLKSAGKR
jgi:hypothetical protein